MAPLFSLGNAYEKNMAWPVNNEKPTQTEPSFDHLPGGAEVSLHPNEHGRKERGRHKVQRIVGHDLTLEVAAVLKHQLDQT